MFYVVRKYFVQYRRYANTTQRYKIFQYNIIKKLKKEGIEKFLKRNPATCFVAEEDSKIVGVIMAGNDGRRGYIYHTAVLPEFRGKHVAKTLVENAMAALEKEGITKVALVVFEKNKNGKTFVFL